MMTVRVLLVALLSMTVASGSGCCRGYKILQFRRAGILPMCEGTPPCGGPPPCGSPPPCGGLYDHDEFYDSSLYHTDTMPKYDPHVNRYYPPYVEPKSITHKCVCSKSVSSQRVMSGVPRYYKRGYCGDMDAVGPCGHYPCGQYGDCGQYGHCPPCAHYGHCAQHACAMPQPLYRQCAHRVLPLTLPASCVC